LIYFDSFEQYVNSYKYLDDFYFTDLIKCRVETKKLDKEKDCYDRCFDSFLEFEMEYVKPKLIFAFSTRTWQTLKNRITMSIVNKENNDNLTLAKVHGYLFKAIDKDCFIIPLFHMSQRSFNNLLRDSYFDYLKEGLKKFTELKK
jgi:uracil-DNA glycosylase